jgi:hypothetical protein
MRVGESETMESAVARRSNSFGSPSSSMRGYSALSRGLELTFLSTLNDSFSASSRETAGRYSFVDSDSASGLVEHDGDAGCTELVLPGTFGEGIREELGEALHGC